MLQVGPSMLAENDLTFTAGIPVSQQQIQSMHFTVSDERKASSMCLDLDVFLAKKLFA